MPGVASLAKGEYYAHPRNAFWPIMGALLSFAHDAPYAIRARTLARAGLAVWDVLASCERPGSLDSAIDISSVQLNDFENFFATHRLLHHVFCNGTTAFTYFRRWALPRVPRALQVTRLPSTSPAHAGLPFARKLAAWRAIVSALNETDARPRS